MSEYELIRSRRKTLGLEVTRDCRVLVRAPMRAARADIERFVQMHESWIARALVRQGARRAAYPEPDAQRCEQLRAEAKSVLPARVRHFARLMQLYPTGLRITAARTRFGSCSAKNSLCFSLHLMAYPMEAVDYVVVHELAHIVHKNHGKAFWALVEHFMPDYRARRALLR